MTGTSRYSRPLVGRGRLAVVDVPVGQGVGDCGAFPGPRPGPGPGDQVHQQISKPKRGTVSGSRPQPLGMTSWLVTAYEGH